MCDIINSFLRDRGEKPISSSTIYRIFRKNGVNRLKPKMKEKQEENYQAEVWGIRSYRLPLFV